MRYQAISLFVSKLTFIGDFSPSEHRKSTGVESDSAPTSSQMDKRDRHLPVRSLRKSVSLKGLLDHKDEQVVVVMSSLILLPLFSVDYFLRCKVVKLRIGFRCC